MERLEEYIRKHKVRLIASDLDGTLLLKGAQQLQTETFRLIHELTEEGIVFLAASGRQYPNLRRLFGPVHGEIGYLCENGCLSFLNGEMIHQAELDRDLGQEMIHAIMDDPTAELLIDGVETCYLAPKKMSYYYHMRDVVRNNVTLVKDPYSTPEAYMKISLYEEGGLVDIPAWQRKFGDRATVVTGGNDWLDMMPKGVNKAFGIRPILQKLGIAPEECMAFGDNDNDREMLEMVGWPVAVDSAKKGILEISSDHTDTVEHYLQRVLEAIRR